jgi:hypothetical protein
MEKGRTSEICIYFILLMYHVCVDVFSYFTFIKK